MALPMMKKEYYTYTDYLNWPEEERWEIIQGEPYDMTPAPDTRHQRICRDLGLLMYQCLQGSICELFMAPFDVRLPLENKDNAELINVVQPDITVICDAAKIDDKGCKGAPDLIVEIISPGTALKDQREKFYLYQEAGIKEYWLVHPIDKVIQVFELQEDGKFAQAKIYSFQETVKSGLFPEMEIFWVNLHEKNLPTEHTELHRKKNLNYNKL